jgi:hypothetical protein
VRVDYGYHTLLWGWLDTVTDNYPVSLAARLTAPSVAPLLNHPRTASSLTYDRGSLARSRLYGVSAPGLESVSLLGGDGGRIRLDRCLGADDRRFAL